MVVIDFSGGAQRKVEIEEWASRAWRQGRVDGKDGVCPHPSGDFSRGTVDLVVLPTDFHLENFVGVFPCFDLGVGNEGDQAVRRII